jgi:hypothetical protein
MTWQTCGYLSALFWLALLIFVLFATAISWGAIIVYRSINWAKVFRRAR